MKSKDEEVTTKKVWFKTWWGVTLAIIFLPLFLIWYIWAKTSWNLAIKIILSWILLGFFALVLLASSSSPVTTPTVKTEESLPQIEVISKNFYPFSSSAYIMGEIKNSDITAGYINAVTVKLKSAGKVVATGESIWTPSFIAKGETLPYLTAINNAPKYDTIEVTTETKTVSQGGKRGQCTRVNVLNKDLRTASSSSVAGEIKNDTAKTLKSVSIYAWFLNNEGKTVWVFNSSIDDLAKGQQKPYDITSPINDSKSVKVVAESCGI